MPVLFDRPDGDQRSVTVSLTDHEWGKLGTKNACLLRFQVDFRYGRDQRFREARIELLFSATDGENPEIKNYGPVRLESEPTKEEHVNSTNGQVAVSVPTIQGVEATIGANRQSSWTQLHSGKVQGHRKLQKGSTRQDALSFQMEEDGRAKAGVPRIVRAAVVVETDSDFTVSAVKPWTNPYGFAWTPHNKKLQVDNPVPVPFEEGKQDFSGLTSDDWNNMVLLGSGPQLLNNSGSEIDIAAGPSDYPAPTLPEFKWSKEHTRWYYQNGSTWVWVQGPWGQMEDAILGWQRHPDKMDRYYDGENWKDFGQ